MSGAVAVSMRVVADPRHGELRDALSHDWQRWFAAHGDRFAPVPNLLAEPAAWLAALAPAAVLLTGGNDLVPRPGGADETSPARTATETAMIAHALDRGLPLFGACRGLQMVNRHFGGGLSADLAGAVAGPGHVGRDHAVRLSAPFDRLAGAAEVATNSFHDQGVLPGQVAPGLCVFAQAAGDGVVEGLVHESLPILAVQWHPERPGGDAAAFTRALFERLLADGAFWRRAAA